MRKLYYSLAFLFCTCAVFAQGSYMKNAQKSYQSLERARMLYQGHQDTEALTEVKKACALDSTNIEAFLLQAVLYEDAKYIDSAVYSYRHALTLNPDFFPQTLYTLAKLETSIGLYGEADTHFTQFLQHPKAPPTFKGDAENRKKKNLISLALSRQQVPFNPYNLGDSINTEYDEYLPVLTADGQTLIFTKRYEKPLPNPHFEEDFFISVKDSLGAWTKAVPMPEPLNSNQNEGAQSISPDGKYLFFAACNREDGYGSCDIFASRKKGEVWEKPFNIGMPINTRVWESQPCIASDGRTLYFCSNRENGLGLTDIWVSRLQDNGIWTHPVNLGPNINTKGSESSPFIHPDGQTLYFSSNGHEGLGGMDIFYSKKQADGSWGKAVNIGFPINTYSDEITLAVNAKGDTAYFASTKSGGKGGQDIYTFELYKEARPNRVSYMKGRVMDAKTEKPIGTAFELTDLKTKEVHTRANSDEITGEFLVSMPYNQNFALIVEKEGYLFYSEHIYLDSIDTIPVLYKIIALSPIAKGENIVLRNLFFAVNSAELQGESIVELEKLLAFMEKNPKISIEISGHTDNQGTQLYNQTLSENRALAVKKYLEEKGITPSRLKAIGHGFSKPLNTNETEEGRALNRRTEILIL